MTDRETVTTREQAIDALQFVLSRLAWMEMDESAHKIRQTLAYLIVSHPLDRKPDPPQPEGKEVRIAVCLSRTGLVSAQAINDGEDEDAVMASCSCVSEHLGLTLCQAIITAVIPKRAIPDVTGKVEP
jgi:hypothetical protein